MEQAYKTVVTGFVVGTTSATQLDDCSCAKVKFKALRGNSGFVYIGASGVTKTITGSNNQTTGYQLDAGEETDWIPVENINKFYRNCDSTSDHLCFIALK